MKWLLYSLLLINIILFTVHYKEQATVRAEYSVEKSVSEIRLLGGEGKSETGTSKKCVVIEEFAEKEGFEKIKSRLDAENIEYYEGLTEEVRASNYWVFVKPEGDLVQLRAKLKAADVEYYEVAAGELKGMLSVGLFENIDLARKRIKYIESLGIEADSFERKRVKNSKWIEIEINNNVGRGRVLEVLEKLFVPSGEIKEFFCKSIASEK